MNVRDIAIRVFEDHHRLQPVDELSSENRLCAACRDPFPCAARNLATLVLGVEYDVNLRAVVVAGTNSIVRTDLENSR